MKTRLLLGLIAGCVAFSDGVRAQDSWPTKPIRWIVTYAVGGGVDISSRIITPKISELLGQQILVDNRPGAGGVIGADVGAKAAPDGYTVLMAVPPRSGSTRGSTRSCPTTPIRISPPSGRRSSRPSRSACRFRSPPPT